MVKLTISMAIPNSYVKLPEGIFTFHRLRFPSELTMPSHALTSELFWHIVSHILTHLGFLTISATICMFIVHVFSNCLCHSWSTEETLVLCGICLLCFVSHEGPENWPSKFEHSYSLAYRKSLQCEIGNICFEISVIRKCLGCSKVGHRLEGCTSKAAFEIERLRAKWEKTRHKPGCRNNSGRQTERKGTQKRKRGKHTPKRMLQRRSARSVRMIV